MQTGLVARRTQFSSCDECRRLRVRCDALQRDAARAASCTRCLKRRRHCTFEWMNDPKRHGKKEPLVGTRRRLRPGSASSTPGSNTSSPHGDEPLANGLLVDPAMQGLTGEASVCDDRIRNGFTASRMDSPLDTLNLDDVHWLQGIYLGGFDTIFGSWMSRYGCPFLSKDGLGDDYTCISDVCSRLDQWMRDMSPGESRASLTGYTGSPGEEDRVADQSLQNAIAAFSARWLPIFSGKSQTDGSYQAIIHALWRYARRDMLRVINRPSYRSMLTLFLFALTPVPTGIIEEEELDGISGQACIHAALQQIQMLRARQRSLQFNGTNVSQPVKSKAIPTIPDTVGATHFIDAENVAYWAALTFDTSASLTLNCRPLLSSGLFGFEAELPWRLVRAGGTIFQKEMEDLPAQDVYNMSDERANKIIASATAWKLLVWKLTAVFKEALRDGYDGAEVTRAFSLVVGAIQQFNSTYRGPLEACQRRMPFLGQQTKFRWYSLMLHYHLSILLLVNGIEDTDRADLLADLEEAYADAENVVVNTFMFGLHNTITLNAKVDLAPGSMNSPSESPITVPLISIDPYQHHIVAAVELVHRAIDRDLVFGKVNEATHASLRAVLERALTNLPQSSKSVKTAKDTFPLKGSNRSVAQRPHLYSIMQGQYIE